MNKKEFVEAVALYLGETKKRSAEIVDGLFTTLARESKEGDIGVKPFFSTKVKQVKQREGRNPKTGEKLTIPAKEKVVIKLGGAFDIETD